MCGNMPAGLASLIKPATSPLVVYAVLLSHTVIACVTRSRCDMCWVGVLVVVLLWRDAIAPRDQEYQQQRLLPGRSEQPQRHV